jgi:virulence-associated protein VapD
MDFSNIYDQEFWQRKPQFPDAISAVVDEELGAFYYSHRKLETLFLEHGAPVDVPEGNCSGKCTTWLKRAARDPQSDAFVLLGGVLRDFMDGAGSGNYFNEDRTLRAHKRVRQILEKHGFSYQEGGQIIKSETGAPVKALQQMLCVRDLSSVQKEFDRALNNVERDPEAALTGACTILESLCKVYIEDEWLTLPKDQSLQSLWKAVRKDLSLDPAVIEDNDIQKILSGLISIVDGIAAFRTHAGSAHGRGRKRYKLHPRHSRLGIHAANTLCAFVLETWDHQKTKALASASA